MLLSRYLFIDKLWWLHSWPCWCCIEETRLTSIIYLLTVAMAPWSRVSVWRLYIKLIGWFEAAADLRWWWTIPCFGTVAVNWYTLYCSWLQLQQLWRLWVRKNRCWCTDNLRNNTSCKNDIQHPIRKGMVDCWAACNWSKNVCGQSSKPQNYGLFLVLINTIYATRFVYELSVLKRYWYDLKMNSSFGSLTVLSR